MNKIVHQIELLVINLVVFLLPAVTARCQPAGLNKYGLRVIMDTRELQKSCRSLPGKKMVILAPSPGLVLDLRYSTPNNFMRQALYPSLRYTFLRKAAADALQQVSVELGGKGIGLKIFDAYRPYSVTEKMWGLVKDDRYAADPRKGSGHNRGIAVDLTLLWLNNGQELDMGTGFDNFSDTAHHAFTALPAVVLQNRQLLKSTMEKYGFKALDTEWWHYYLPDSNNFELLDIPFAELKKRR